MMAVATSRKIGFGNISVKRSGRRASWNEENYSGYGGANHIDKQDVNYT